MIGWSFQSFDALTASELYEVVTLRQEVFVVEQNCAYRDCDGLDPAAFHLLGRTTDGLLAAYARVLPPGSAFAEAAFGRVVTHPRVRGSGYGRELVREAIRRTGASFAGPIRIGAQQRLVRFYAQFGFVTASAPYDEDGIPHVEMLLG
jgi:ElaA protein